MIVNGFGEEIGWRGFLVDRLLERHGVVATALIVASIWACWHAPMFWVVTWLYLSSGRSIWVVSLWHTAFNFTTATTAATGVPAAASTLVKAAAVAIAVGSRRQRRAV